MERETEGTSRMQSPSRLSSVSWRSAALQAQSWAACWLLHALWTGLSHSSSLGCGARKLLSCEKQSWRQRPERDGLQWLRHQQTSAPGTENYLTQESIQKGKSSLEWIFFKERNHLWHGHQRTKIMWVEKAELLWHLGSFFSPQKNNVLKKHNWEINAVDTDIDKRRFPRGTGSHGYGGWEGSGFPKPTGCLWRQIGHVQVILKMECS